MTLHYRPFEPRDHDFLLEVMPQLYQEDPGTQNMTEEKIRRTFQALSGHPDRGTIMILEKDEEPVGYAILIYFWSNEFGGIFLNIDEFFIKKPFRSQGIGTQFIQYLAKSRFGDAVGLYLEVTPKNTRARRLYEKLGFKAYRNDSLFWFLDN